MNYIEMNWNKVGGVPVLKGTRFSISQLLAEIADGASVNDIASDFDLDLGTIQKALHELAVRYELKSR